MERIARLEQKVHELYEQQDPKRTPWADWFAGNHVFVVAEYAEELARRYDANPELARAAALLHDIADAKMHRNDQQHEAESLQMARDLMRENGYSTAEMKLVVDDAIRHHSCYNDTRPSSMEGQVLATADSMAHLKTDFYIFATWVIGDEMTLPEVKAWVLKKVERDLYSKVCFDEIRQELTPDYEAIKRLFSR